MANEYPLPKFHFQVEWGGTKIAFTEVTGLEVTQEVIEYRDGAMPEMTFIKQAGLRKYSNITLKRGMFKGDNEYFLWWDSVKIQNYDDRRDVTISLLDENHTPVVTWKVKKAWPTKIQSDNLKSDANEVFIETLELAHEGFVLEA